MNMNNNNSKNNNVIKSAFTAEPQYRAIVLIPNS